MNTFKDTNIKNLDLSGLKYEDVVITYNGKSGCACGCLGTYHVPSADLIDEANRQTGYNYYEEKSVKPRACKRRFNGVLADIEFFKDFDRDELRLRGQDVSIGAMVNDKSEIEFIWSDVDGRTTTVYFKPHWK